MCAKRGSTKPLSYEERVKIYELLQEGLTYRTIGKRIERCADTIALELVRGGGSQSYCPGEAQKMYEEKKANASRRRLRTYSIEERTLLEKAVLQGYTKNKISIESGISYFRVVKYLEKYHSGYKPSTDQIKMERISLEGRVISIEMRLEILLEQIKELTKCLK